MDPYVLALQLYLFNKACGGLPLRIAEQVVITGVINTTYWTAQTIGSGVMWLARHSTTSRTQTVTQQTNTNTNTITTPNEGIITPDQQITNNQDSQSEYLAFEIITVDQITEMEKQK
jgi:hypothetical protein